MPSNSLKMTSYGLFSTWASTFSRPRWAMPMHDLLDAERRAVVDSVLISGIERLAAFEAEPLLPDEARVQEPLELLGGDELEQDRPRLVGREVRAG